MARLVAKYHSIYLFIITLSIIGFITGYFYYQVQEDNVKVEINETIDIENTLNNGFNNTFKRFKEIAVLFVCSFFIITILFNIFKVFTMPFELGFLFNLLKGYKFKFCLIYLGLYYLIPLIIMMILIRISLTLTVNIIKLLIFRDRKIFIYIKRQVLKYIIIGVFLIFYEFILSIFSYNINLYLMTFIK